MVQEQDDQIGEEPATDAEPAQAAEPAGNPLTGASAVPPAGGTATVVNEPPGGAGDEYRWHTGINRPTGVPDAVDRVPDSNMDSTVLIFGVDSGVENRADAKGVTLADRLSKIKEPKNRQQAFSRFFRVVVSIYQLQRRDLISEDEANALFQIAFRGAFRP